jgi:hypothetical protein
MKRFLTTGSNGQGQKAKLPKEILEAILPMQSIETSERLYIANWRTFFGDPVQ